MENASKALIIAGAILISILLISIGIMVINSAGGLTETAQKSMDKQTLDAFNAQFTSYEGNNVRGATVRDLYSAVIASNSTYTEYPVKIKYNGTEQASPSSSDRNAINRSGSYTVNCVMGDDGRVVTIEINSAGGSTSST